MLRKKVTRSSPGNKGPSFCRHGGPRATSHILECINIMVNHNEFGVTDEEVDECGKEGMVQQLLLKKMTRFIARHPEAACDNVIKTLIALAVDELLLNGSLEGARRMYQPVPFLKFFKAYGVEGMKSHWADMEKAAASVNYVSEKKGMLGALKKEVGAACQCLDHYKVKPPSPLDDEHEVITYAESLVMPFLKIPVKNKNAVGQDSRLHVEIRRLCAPNDKPPYLCIIMAPASRYIFHSFPVEETKADEAFLHVLEGIVTAVVTEGMGMVKDDTRIRPAMLTTNDPLLVKFLSPLLHGTRVLMSLSSDTIVDADSNSITKESPLIAILGGVFADFNIEIKANSKRKLPIGDIMSADAKWKVKSKTAAGRDKYVVDDEAEGREIPDRMMACKGCNELQIRSALSNCSLCNEVWYCGNECQARDWTAGHKTECTRKNEGKLKTKVGGHVSEDSGDDLGEQEARAALKSFKLSERAAAMLVEGAAKKKAGGKKAKGKKR